MSLYGTRGLLHGVTAVLQAPCGPDNLYSDDGLVGRNQRRLARLRPVRAFLAAAIGQVPRILTQNPLLPRAVIMHCSNEVKAQAVPLSPSLPPYWTHQGRYTSPAAGWPSIASVADAVRPGSRRRRRSQMTGRSSAEVAQHLHLGVRSQIPADQRVACRPKHRVNTRGPVHSLGCPEYPAKAVAWM